MLTEMNTLFKNKLLKSDRKENVGRKKKKKHRISRNRITTDLIADENNL